MIENINLIYRKFYGNHKNIDLNSAILLLTIKFEKSWYLIIIWAITFARSIRSILAYMHL